MRHDDGTAGLEEARWCSAPPGQGVACPCHGCGPARRVLTNIGGPGYPGGTLFPLFFYFFKPDIVAAYDVVGVDPRGSGESTPVFCNDDVAVEPADVRDRSPQNLALLRLHAKANLDRCLEPAGDLAGYMDATRQSVTSTSFALASESKRSATTACLRARGSVPGMSPSSGSA